MNAEFSPRDSGKSKTIPCYLRFSAASADPVSKSLTLTALAESCGCSRRLARSKRARLPACIHINVYTMPSQGNPSGCQQLWKLCWEMLLLVNHRKSAH